MLLVALKLKDLSRSGVNIKPLPSARAWSPTRTASPAIRPPVRLPPPAASSRISAATSDVLAKVSGVPAAAGVVRAPLRVTVLVDCRAALLCSAGSCYRNRPGGVIGDRPAAP